MGSYTFNLNQYVKSPSDAEGTAKQFTIEGPATLTREQAQAIFEKQVNTGALTGFKAGDVLSAATQAAAGLAGAQAQLTGGISSLGALVSKATNGATSALTKLPVLNGINPGDFAKQLPGLTSIGSIDASQVTGVLAQAGKGMEGLIDETADQFRNKAKAMEGQPKPPPVEIQKLQMQMQAKQAEMQVQSQLEVQKLQAQTEAEKAKQEFQAQENQLKFQLEDQRNQRELEMQAQLDKMKAEMENNKDILLAYLDNSTKIETARISAGFTDGTEAYTEAVEQAKIMQDTMGYHDMANHPLQPVIENMQNSNNQMAQVLAALIDKLSQPKQVVRDENGKIVGVQ